MERLGKWFVLIISVLLVVACGGLRFSQLDTDATGYHPRKVAVFPVSVGSYEEARNPVEKIVPAELAAKKWFTSVIDTASLNSQMQSNDELRQVVTDYISKQLFFLSFENHFSSFNNSNMRSNSFQFAQNMT